MGRAVKRKQIELLSNSRNEKEINRESNNSTLKITRVVSGFDYDYSEALGHLSPVH
jgi:hypothetical protein